MFDSHSVRTGISFSASSSLSLFLFLILGTALVPPRPSRSLAHVRTDVFSLSPSFFPSRSFSLSSPLDSLSAGRSAPDYLGSECLIEALYRWDPGLLASLGRPAPLLEFGGDTTSPLLLPPFRSRSPSSPSHPRFPVPASSSPPPSPPLPPRPPPPLYIYSFICWWLIPHYRDRSTDKRNVLGNTQCAPPSSRLSRSSSVIGNRREEGVGGLRDGGEDKDEAASGAEAHILRTTSSFRSLFLSPSLPRPFLLFPLSSTPLRESKYHRGPLTRLDSPSLPRAQLRHNSI